MLTLFFSTVRELMVPRVQAAEFSGNGLQAGLEIAKQVIGPLHLDAPGASGVRQLIVRLLQVGLDFLSLAAVITVVVAGLGLVISGGNSERVERSRRIIVYTVYGLLIVFFARVIVASISVLSSAL
jgi:hypothetical protein